jgi:hypothetical protein
MGGSRSWSRTVRLHLVIQASRLLTEQEQYASAQAGLLYGFIARSIVAHGPTREADLAELVAPIHVIQRMIMGQAAARALGLLHDYTDDRAAQLKADLEARLACLASAQWQRQHQHVELRRVRPVRVELGDLPPSPLHVRTVRRSRFPVQRSRPAFSHS